MPILKTVAANKKAAAAGLLAVAAALLGKRTYDMSAAPVSPKDCDFSYPEKTGDVTPQSAEAKLPAMVQLGGTINDASCLNRTAVYGVVAPTNEQEIGSALAYARDHQLKVTSAGQRHSMGGQSFSPGGLVLDMRQLKQITVAEDGKSVRVQSGATWQDVQKELDSRGLSVKAMQSINIFTVGGTLSVNAHGISHDPGPVSSTVRSIRVMTADGKVVTASRTQNPELFRHVLGGYGLFGVMVDVDLDVVPNETYAWHTDYMDYKDFPKFYADNIEGNKNVGLAFSRVTVSPSNYLTETAVHRYTKVPDAASVPKLQLPGHSWLNRFIINLSKTGSTGRWVRWELEKHIEPSIHPCVSRNSALNQPEACIVTRNQEMYDDMSYLKNRLKDTDILQEYFIPQARMPEFIDGLRETVIRNNANLLNVTIRTVHKDVDTALPYAKEDMFAFVLYFNQGLNEKDSAVLRKTTTDLIDVAAKAGGTYYLPYQLYYSPQQLRTAYPEVDSFFSTKKKYDPTELFVNKFYLKYGKS